LIAWGWNKYGQLGTGENEEINPHPTQLKNLDDEKIISIACGGYHNIALSCETKKKRKTINEMNKY
jgi:alpha-tubulin suppressor-like RCC1 family protein